MMMRLNFDNLKEVRILLPSTFMLFCSQQETLIDISHALSKSKRTSKWWYVIIRTSPFLSV